jgi:hypothetical protein
MTAAAAFPIETGQKSFLIGLQACRRLTAPESRQSERLVLILDAGAKTFRHSQAGMLNIMSKR